MKKEINLNLGCGFDILEGYENYDKYPVNKKVKYLDLEVLPLDIFTNKYANKIRIHNVFEHLKLSIRMDLMKEFHRILKNDGALDIVMPLFMQRIFHQSYFHTKSYFNPFIKENIVSVSGDVEGKYFVLLDFKYIFKSFNKCFPFVKINCRWILKKN